MAKESDVEREVVTWLRSIGAYVSKNPGSFLTGRGLPDRTVCYHGRFIALEFKHPDMPLASQMGCYPFESDDRFAEPAQQMHLKHIRREGGLAFVVNRLWTVKELLRKIDLEEAARST